MSRYAELPENHGVRRDTPAILFRGSLNAVIRNGYYEEASVIMDYALPDDEKKELSNYRFDICALVNGGASEGIYIDVFLRGEFDQSDKNTCPIGTFKTLNDNMNAYRIMGALSGAITFYGHEYVNRNIERYTPEDQLAAEAEREKMKMEDKQ